MDVKNYNRNRKKPVRKKGLRIVAFLLLFIGVVLAVFRYYKFMSKSIYEESVSHLTEVLHQSDQMLRELTNKNLTYLHIWGENLQNISGEDEIRDYIKKAQEDAGFWNSFFYHLTVTTRWRQVKPGILDYRKILKRISGREMM